LKTLASIAVILTAVAGILAVSIATALRDEEQLIEEFTSGARDRVHAAAEVLSARLDALDQDTRFLIDVVERSRRSSALALETERRIWESAFTALAAVVPHYRTIALFAPDGDIEVYGADPTETEATVKALLSESRRLSVVVSASGVKQLGKPAIRYGEQLLLVHGGASAGRLIDKLRRHLHEDVATFLAAPFAAQRHENLVHLLVERAS